MSFGDCIRRAVDDGHIPPERARELLEEHASEAADMGAAMGDVQADAAAARAILDRTRQETFQRRRRTGLTRSTLKRRTDELSEHRTLTGKINPAAALSAMVEDPSGTYAGQTMTGQYHAVRSYLKGPMSEAMRTFRRNALTMRRKKALMMDTLREVFGEETGDAQAKGFAKVWADTAERARTRFNAAGGDIAKLARWNMPQWHDTNKVRGARPGEWADATDGLLDWDAMAERDNGGVPYSAAKRRAILDRVNEDIRTDGHASRNPTAHAGRGMMAKRRSDHRFLIFKDADSWASYNEQFGGGADPFDTMLRHLDSMARDIAMMEVLGPNPTHSWAWLKDGARGIAARSGEKDALKLFEKRLYQAESKFRLFTGETNVPVNERMAATMAATRNWLSASLLGKAVISSISDFNSQRVSAKFVGVGQFQFLSDFVRLAASGANREAAGDLGLILSVGLDYGAAAARHDLEDMVMKSSAGIAESVIRMSGLGFLTETHRTAAGTSRMRAFAAARDKGWGELDPRQRRFLQKMGLTEGDWDLMRAGDMDDFAGLEVMGMNAVRKAAGQEAADRWMAGIYRDIEFAVPSATISGRAAVIGQSKPGTLTGETARAVFQFRSFSLTVLMTHVARSVSEAFDGRPLTAANYAAQLLIWNTILGGVAIQLKEIAAGRDPKDMTTAKFWVAAMAQGGGLGIFGDFIFTDHNRFGGGLGTTLGGPTLGLGTDIVGATLGNVQNVVRGEETNAGAEFVRLGRNYTPGGNLWFADMLWEREVMDRLEDILNPDASRSFRRKRKSARDFDTQFFYPPGAATGGGRSSIRLPDLKNALGDGGR